ncbi:MAG: hypothetical protein ISS71_03275 [Phycisphaerae bacterium]|nr:hypothetical protein [Phycisphaerae bacterium]
MKSRRLYSWIVVVCLCMAGCQRQNRLSSQNWLLVNFQKNVPITYQFTSDRQITIDLTSGSSGKKTKPQTMSEKLDMVITYTPTEVDPFSLTTLVAECRSVEVTRSSLSGKKESMDAMEYLKGKSFTFQLSPTGQIANETDLKRIITEIGQKAFSQSKNDSQRIKNPDMINDFIAMQWHLWDSTSTIDKPLEGMQPGQTWQVKQWIPWPATTSRMPMRMTTYTLDSLTTEEDQPRKAVIKSSYDLADPGKQRFPYPYEGMFQTRGIMGFLRNYKFFAMEGTGTQIFNMEKGLIESDQQEYTLKVNASFMLPLGNSLPVLTIDQTILIKQIENP